MNEASPPSALDAWLARLEAAHPTGIELGLERVAEVADRMELFNSPLARRVITVSGTNGKGSTVAILESVARAHRLSTAAYTSPHLLRYNERLRLDGDEVDDATLIAGFEAVETARLAGDPVSLTYFEVGTLGALWAISRQVPDLAILEVGLGGRLDAVNVIDSDVAVITTIAMDHSDFLGDDLEIIGREKAGILRKGCPVVLGSLSLPASVREEAARLEAPVFALGEAFWLEPHERKQDEEKGSGWAFSGSTAGEGEGVGRLKLTDLPDPGLPLDNAATALQALLLAGVTLEATACRRGLSRIDLPGRMQWIGKWCLDVGHNPHAAAHLAERLAALPCEGRTICLLGMLANKDADGVIDSLMPVIDVWITARLSGDRGRSADDLAGRLVARGAEVWHGADSPTLAADWLAPRLAPSDRVLVCGSFFTVADVLTWWLAHGEPKAQTGSEDTASEGVS